MPSNYENFRTVLTFNLSTVLTDPQQLRDVLAMVDISLHDFEISRKPMEIIPATGVPEVVKYYLASKAIANLSKGTLKQYRYKLTNFFSTVRKSYLDIRANDIRIYLYNYKLEHGSSDCYMDNVRITLNSFFQWLVDNEYLQRNPCAQVEKIKYQPKRREPLTAYSLEDLRWHCEGVREKALVDFLYSTGCRISECANVMLSDIDWHENAVLIRHGKGDKQRVVYFNDEAKVSLQAYLETRQDDTPALWVSTKRPHQQLQSHALENVIRKIGQRIGVHAYPHKLRHTFATMGLRGGMSIEHLQQLLGHASPDTTLIYAKEDKTRVRMEHRRVYA